MKNIKFSLLWAKFKLKFASTRADFYEDVASAVTDGENLTDYVTKREARSREMRDPLGPLYTVWRQRMLDMPFYEAIAADIPATEAMSIKASETSVTLDRDLPFLANTIRGVSSLKKAVFFAMLVPTILMLFVLLANWLFAKHFVPVLIAVMPPEKWPASGKLLLAISNVTGNYGLILAIAFLALVAGLVYSFGKWTGPNRRLVDDYPPYSIYRDFTGSMTLVTLATFMTGGVALVPSIEDTSKNSNPWVRWHLNAIRNRLERDSKNPGRAFDTGMLPRRTLNRIIDRSERSDFSEAMRVIGSNAIVSSQKSIESSAKTINIIMLLLAATSLGILIVGFLETIYSVQNSMSQF